MKWFPGVVGKYSESMSKWRVSYADEDKRIHKFNPDKWRVPVAGHSTRNLKIIQTWTKKKRTHF